MVSLLLFCGLRRGELISLQVRDIDLESRKILIKKETSKSNMNRTLPIHSILFMHLKDYLQERKKLGLTTGFLFVSRNGDQKLTEHGLKHWVKNLRKKSGVRFHLHQFRHTFACKLADVNVSALKIQKLMGHSDIRMTMKYTRSLRPEDMEEDIGKISF